MRFPDEWLMLYIPSLSNNIAKRCLSEDRANYSFSLFLRGAYIPDAPMLSSPSMIESTEVAKERSHPIFHVISIYGSMCPSR